MRLIMKDRKVIIMTVIFIIIMSFIAVKFFVNYKRIDTLQDRIQVLSEKVDKAENKNKALEKELENLNDLKYIEKIARKKLGLVKPGEVLLIPVEEKKEKETND